MKFTQRQVEILRYLNEYPETTMKQISQKIGVTGQTIKTEIQSMEEVLDQYHIAITFQLGKGLKVEGSKYLEELLKFSETNIEFSTKKQIVLILLLNRDFLVLQDIADQLFVSKSQVEKLMPELLKKYEGEICSVRHYGYKYCGSEMNRRKLFVHLISPYMQGSGRSKRISEFDALHFPIKSYIEEKLIEESVCFIKEVVKIKSFAFTDEALKQLFLYVMLSLKEAEIASLKVMGEELLMGIQAISEFKKYRATIEEIEKKLPFSIREPEKDYLSYLFMVLKKKRLPNKEEILEEMQEMILGILKEIEHKLYIDLTQDKNLIEGLSYHLYTTILNASASKYSLEESKGREIKRQYPLAYEMAALAGGQIQAACDYDMNEEELIYLLLHFQAAIEKLKQAEQRIRTVIVCHFGMAACHLISRRIERLFPQIDIIATCSVQEFMEQEEISCDLVVSTEILPSAPAVTIYVTPALKEVEIERIREFVSTRNTNYLISHEIEEAILVNFQGEMTKEELLEQMVLRLEHEGYVLPGYMHSVKEREQMSSTEIPDIAVPHGNPKYVSKLKLVIGRLDAPVRWDEEQVSIIFMLAVPGELLKQNSRVFTNFYKKIGDLKFGMQLMALKDDEDEAFKKGLAKLFK